MTESELWALATAPPIDAARPGRCPHCAAIARPSWGGVVLEGNGIRPRDVVIPVVKGGLRFERITCWSRRFLCTACGRSCVVLPDGVLPGCLYSVAAIAVAWWATWSLADGTAQELAAVGPPGRQDQAPYTNSRWRGPYRWAMQIHRLFPTEPLVNGGWRQWVNGMLTGLMKLARGARPEAIARAAVCRHAGYTQGPFFMGAIAM